MCVSPNTSIICKQPLGYSAFLVSYCHKCALFGSTCLPWGHRFCAFLLENHTAKFRTVDWISIHVFFNELHANLVSKHWNAGKTNLSSFLVCRSFSFPLVNFKELLGCKASNGCLLPSPTPLDWCTQVGSDRQNNNSNNWYLPVGPHPLKLRQVGGRQLEHVGCTTAATQNHCLLRADCGTSHAHTFS